MKRICVVLIVLLCFISCSKKNLIGEIQQVNNIKPVDKQNIANETPKPIFFKLFESTDYYNKLVFSNEILEKDCALYSMEEDYSPIQINTLQKGTKVVILAETQKAHEKIGKGYYLIQDLKEDNLWSGWIDKEAISTKPNAEYPQFIMYSGFINISKSNNKIAFSTSWQGKILVANRKGDVIANVPYSDIQKTYPDAVDGSIIAWSMDEKYVWFETFMDSYTVCFGRIDTNSGTFEIIDRPENFKSYQIEIDFNTGNCLYSDYPYQFDTETATETKKSKQEFTLYYTNLFTKETKKVVSNYGEGFDINKNGNGELVYRINTKEDYIPVR